MSRRGTGGNEFYDILETPLGMLYLVFSGHLLTGIMFEKPAGLLIKRTRRPGLQKESLPNISKKAEESSAAGPLFWKAPISKRKSGTC
jgi:hypothetical protein